MKNKSYKQWIIVFLMCCLSSSSIGLCTNSIGVFYTPVSQSLNILRGTFAMHATLSSLATAFMSLFMTKIMHRYCYKNILIIGVLFTSLSTFLMAYSRSVWMFYILGIIRGIGIGIYGMVPLTVIITNWFMEKHGLATSIALSFSGLSGAIFSPILSSWITTFGWEHTYKLMAVCILVLTLPALFYQWTIKPQNQNLLPYGYHQETRSQSTTATKRMNFMTCAFLCMCILTVLHTSITGISQHLSGMATSIQLSSSIGAMMMSLVMFGNISTKLLIGFLSDLLNPLKSSLIMIFVNIVSLCLLWNSMITGQLTLLLISSFAFGSIYSVGAVGIPLLTRYFFGLQNYSQAYAIIGFLTNVGSSSSLALIGYAFDFTGGYQLVIIIALLFHAVNLILLFITNLVYKKEYQQVTNR